MKKTKQTELAIREQFARRELQNNKLLLRVLDELNSPESGVRHDVDGGAYYVTGSSRWLKIVSEVGLISPMQFLALLLCGYDGLHGWQVRAESRIVNEWAAHTRCRGHTRSRFRKLDLLSLVIDVARP